MYEIWSKTWTAWQKLLMRYERKSLAWKTYWQANKGCKKRNLITPQRLDIAHRAHKYQTFYALESLTLLAFVESHFEYPTGRGHKWMCGSFPSFGVGCETKRIFLSMRRWVITEGMARGCRVTDERKAMLSLKYDCNNILNYTTSYARGELLYQVNRVNIMEWFWSRVTSKQQHL